MSDFVPLFGDPRECRGYVALLPTGGPREGRGEATTCDFVPLFGGVRECRVYIAPPPSCGPLRRQG